MGIPGSRPWLRSLSRLAGALLCVGLAACGQTAAEEDEGPIRATATISIIADFVAQVGGERVRVDTIVPIAGDPHTHEPTPGDARLVADADIVFVNGLGLERLLERLVESGATGPVVTVAEGLPAVRGEMPGQPDAVDPHLWMDPHLAMGYVEAIRDGLAALDPDGAEHYAQGALAAIEDLEELDRWTREQVATIPEGRRKLVTTHDAFRYFGERYGFDVVGSLWGISTEREPSAAEVRELVDAVRDAGVPTVFVETTVNPRLMERVARDADVGVGAPLYGDSVGPPGSGAETYRGMMEANVRALVEGLG